MPDNNIKANINVNMQSNVKEQTQLIMAQFAGVTEAIERCMNDPLSATDHEIKEIGKALGHLHNNVGKIELNNLYDPEKLQATKDVITRLENSYKSLKDITQNAKANEFENLEGSMLKSLDKLESTMNKALNNPLNVSESKLEKLNNEINTFSDSIKGISKHISFDEFSEASDILSVYKKKLDLIIDTKGAFSSFKDTLSETKYLINSYKIDPHNFDVSSITSNIGKLKDGLDDLKLVMDTEQYYKYKSSIDNITSSYEKQVQAIEKLKQSNETQSLSGLDDALKEMEKLEETGLQRLARLQTELANNIQSKKEYETQALSGLDEALKETEKLDKEMAKLEETELQRLARLQMALPNNQLKRRQEILDSIDNGGIKSVLSGFNNDSPLLDDMTLLSKEIENGLDRIKSELDEISSDRVYINTSDAIQDLRELEQSLINTKQVLETQLANGDIDFNSYAEGVKQVNELYDQLRKVATDNGFVKAQEDVNGFNEQVDKAIEKIKEKERAEAEENNQLKDGINNFKGTLAETKYLINSYKLNPQNFDTSSITRNIDLLKNSLNELELVISKEQYYKFKSDIDSLTNSFEKQVQAVAKSNSSGKIFDKITGAAGTKIVELGAKLFTVGAIVKGVKAGFELFEDTLKDIGEIAISAGQTIGDGFEFAVDTIGNMIDLLGEASDKIKDLADEGVGLNQKYFVLSRTLGTENARSANGVLGKIASLYGMDSDNLIDGFNTLNLTLSKMGANVEDVSGAFTNMALNLSAAFGEDFNAVASKLQSAITMGYLGQNSIIARTLLKNDDERKAFKELNSEVERAQFLFDRAGRANGAMANWMNTAAGKVTMMNQSFSSLNNNVQRLAVGIMSKLAPVIIAVTNLVNRLVVALTKLLNIDMEGFDQNFEGISFDSSGLSENLDDVSDSIDKVSDSANKAKKNLASFDDVIQINDNSSLSDVDDLADNIDDLSGLNGTLDLSAFNLDLEESNEELSEFEKHLEKIGDLIEQGKWKEAGKELNIALKEVLEGIHWDDIKKKAAELGQGFAEFTNGLFEDEQLGYDIGQFLVEAINTAFTFLYNYISNTNFNEIGEFLGQSVIGFFENMDSDTIGKTIAETFNKAIDFVKGFVDDMFEHKVFKDVPKDIDTGWELVGYKISDIINKAFADLDAEEAADTLIKFVDGIFTTLGTLIENLDTKTIKEKFRIFISKVFEGFKQNSGEWAKTISEFVDFIIDMIDTFFETYDASGMREAIMNFLKNSKIGDLVWRIIEAEMQLKIELFMIKLSGFLGSIVDKILEWGGGSLIGVLSSIYVIITKWGAGLFSAIARKLGELLGQLIMNIGQFFVNIGTSIADGGRRIIAKVIELFASAKEKVANGLNVIKNFFNPLKWVQVGKEALQGLWNGLKSVWDSITGWFRKLTLPSFKLPKIIGGGTIGGGNLFNIPQLASGGIIRQSTIANIGEAGKEAVIPLENNTGWMDTLAAKVAGQIGNGAGTNGNPVIIDMSKATKQVYTRSEMLAFGREVAESLKLAGFVVSVNV